jgi:O-antigen/teichoic acid export membrane protein
MGLFGAQFAGEWPVLVVVLVTAGIVAVVGPIGHWIVASNRLWLNVTQYSIWGVSFIVLTYILVPWGAIGLSLARAGAYSIHGVLVLFTARKILSLHCGVRMSAVFDYMLRTLFGRKGRST